MDKITIKIENNKVYAKTPFHPDFPPNARKIGGDWNNPYWIFDIRDEARVRELCRNIFGTDGEDNTDLVTIRVTIINEHFRIPQNSFFLAGRLVAKAWGRDSGAKLGDGIIVLEGGFDSGGSVKNWTTTITDWPTVFEVRDIPKKAAEMEIERQKENKEVSIEIIEDAPDKDALITEKERLLTRIAEIEKLLKG
jgi:hypothetical protein